MKKVIAVLISILMLLLMLSSCAPSVPQEEYDKLSEDLDTAESRIRLLQTKVDEMTFRTNKAVFYSLFLDILLFPFFVGEEDITLRANYQSEAEWFEQMRATASRLQDDHLVELVDQFEKGEISITIVLDYVIVTLEETLE